MADRDVATEAWIQRHLDVAPPLTAQQLDLVRRTFGRVQLEPPSATSDAVDAA